MTDPIVGSVRKRTDSLRKVLRAEIVCTACTPWRGTPLYDKGAVEVYLSDLEIPDKAADYYRYVVCTKCGRRWNVFTGSWDKAPRQVWNPRTRTLETVPGETE